MDNIDPRIVRITVEVEGELKVYEGLDIVARGQKAANPLQNTCEVTISNLSQDVRNYLLTETSPFNRNKKPKRLIVEAGRESMGVARLFQGEIISATPSQPPDIGLTIKAQTGAFSKGQIVARSGGAQTSLKALAGQVAADLGVRLDFQAPDKQVANYSFSGAKLRQVDELARAGGVDAFVDDDTLVVKARGEPLANRVRILSKDSGLVGVPEFTEHGVKVTYLLDNTTILGGAIEVQSQINPATNGSYTIFKLDFEVASRQPPFYFIAEAKRPGFKAVKT